ncbi:MAG: hypothetical protein EBE86_031350 [Hormoscilla sp. GUM202]|nr:hypothetical protein [Hormoscilla sp. GUM202]
MSKIEYVTMSDQQLRQYFLEHRQDEAALKAYLDRRHQRSTEVITTANDPDFDAKIIAAIRQQMSDNI